MAMQYNDSYAENVYTFANNIATPDGGTHLQGFIVLAQILRTLKGYDSYNSLLLPPRLPGEKLPPEVYEYFREIKRSKEEQMKVKYLETLAQENGENSTALEPLASLRYLYWEMNQLLNTR